MVVVNMTSWAVGTEVTCPRCGRVGRAGVDKFRAKGRVYEYYVVRHYEGGKVKRCVIGPAEEPAAGPSTAEPTPQVPETRPAPVHDNTPIVAATASPRVEVKGEVRVVEVPEPPRLQDAEPLPPEVDRLAWYIVKLASSWGSLRESPSEENLGRFVKAADQVAQRLGIAAGDVIAAAEYYARTRTERAKMLVNEALKRLIARMVIASTTRPASAEAEPPAAGTPEVRVEVPREVVEAIQSIGSQVAGMQRELEYIREQVRQRKGIGARAVARGEKKVEIKEGNLYFMIREALRDLGEATKEQIAQYIGIKFGKRVSGNSLSGRLSELSAAGYVLGRRVGRTWLWRWVGP